jgi:O-antigen ligase
VGTLTGNLTSSAWVEPFRAVERRDPTLAFLHLAAACLWSACISFGHAPEGIAYGALLVAAALRVPRTFTLYRPLLGSLPFLFFAAWTAWRLCSHMWSDVPLQRWSELFPRPFFATLALWPLVHRLNMIIASLAVGALVGACYTVVTSVGTEGVRARENAGRLIRHLFSASFMGVVGACALAALAVHARKFNAWAVALVASGACCLQVAILAGRASMVALAAGLGALLLRRAQRSMPWSRTATLGVIVAVIAAAAVVNGPYLAERFRNLHPSAEPDSTIHDTLILPIANERVTLWRVAWTMGWDRPITGHGVDTWKEVGGAYIAANYESYGKSKGDAAFLASLPSPHNMYLNTWFTTGAVGLCLLVGMSLLLLNGFWRATPSSWMGRAMLGIAMTWCVAGIFAAADDIAVGSSVLALMVVARAALPAMAEPLNGARHTA